jgi:aldose 1-epimerase
MDTEALPAVPVYPSGEQVEISFEDQQAVVVSLGGGLRTYDVGGRGVLDGYELAQMVTGARGQPLIPWPNRLHTGRYFWQGSEHVVPLDEPSQQNALHGLTRWREWTPDAVTPSAATMRLLLLPQPAYPFALGLAIRYELGPDGLTVTTAATNLGDVEAPYGHGAHPYLTVGTERIDEALLTVPAKTWLPTGPAQIPVGRESVDQTPYDFRTPRRLGRLRIDHTFTDLDRDSRGRGTVVLAAAEGAPRTSLWVDSAYQYLEIFTGDTLPEGERRRGLGVEPMSCPPDAFRTGDGIISLRPGRTVSMQWGITAA